MRKWIKDVVNKSWGWHAELRQEGDDAGGFNKTLHNEPRGKTQLNQSQALQYKQLIKCRKTIHTAMNTLSNNEVKQTKTTLYYIPPPLDLYQYYWEDKC